MELTSELEFEEPEAGGKSKLPADKETLRIASEADTAASDAAVLWRAGCVLCAVADEEIWVGSVGNAEDKLRNAEPTSVDGE